MISNDKIAGQEQAVRDAAVRAAQEEKNQALEAAREAVACAIEAPDSRYPKLIPEIRIQKREAIEVGRYRPT